MRLGTSSKFNLDDVLCMILDLGLSTLRRLQDFTLPEELVDKAALLVLGAFTPLLGGLIHCLMALSSTFAAAV